MIKTLKFVVRSKSWERKRDFSYKYEYENLSKKKGKNLKNFKMKMVTQNMGISGEYFKLGKNCWTKNRENISQLRENSKIRIFNTNFSLSRKETPKKDSSYKSNNRPFTNFKMEDIVKTIETQKKIFRNKALYKSRSQTAKSDSGSRPRISNFNFGRKETGTKNKALIASGNKYFSSTEEKSTINKNNHSLSTWISPQTGQKFTQMPDIYKISSPKNSDSQYDDIIADEHISTDHRKIFTQLQPRQKKFMNNIIIEELSSSQPENTYIKGHKIQMR